MRFDLDEKDLKVLSRVQEYFALDDETPEYLFKNITRLVEKINKQIPERDAVTTVRRVRS